MDFGKSSKSLQKPVDYHGANVEQQPEFDRIQFSQLLMQRAVPHLGIYGYEYHWLQHTAEFRREFKTPQEFMEFRQCLPTRINDIIDERKELNFSKNCQNVHYYIINMNARELRNQCLVDKNQSRIRLNFAPHAFLHPMVRKGEEFKDEVHASVFTSHHSEFMHSSMRGIDECNDFGRISVNCGKLTNKSNIQEVHIHPVDDQTAISPNNQAFLLNLTFPIVNFHILMLYTDKHNNYHLGIFNYTIVNDESLKLNREIDTALNVAKIVTYTPNRTDIQDSKKKFYVPSMYVKVLEHTCRRVTGAINNYFSAFMERYEAAQDKEGLIKELFTKLFSDHEINSAIEPYITTVGEEYLKLFYKFIWFKCKSPDVEDFGKRFFFEVCDTNFQIHLIQKFNEIMVSMYDELYMEHSSALAKYIPAHHEIDEEHQMALGQIESLLLQPPQIFLKQGSNNDEEMKQELAQIDKPVIKINDEQVKEVEPQSDFLQKFPKQVNFPISDNLQAHLEALFSADRKLVENTFNQLPKVMQDYIGFEAWRNKGQIHGIHNDFGRHSYLQTPEIGQYYHFSNDDRVNFILMLQDMFANL